MAVVQLDDGTARVEVTVFNELFEASRSLLKEDTAADRRRPAAARRVHRRHPHRRGQGATTCRRARHASRAACKLVCNGGSSGARLRELLAPYRNGAVPGVHRLQQQDAECRIDLGEDWRVKLDDGLIQSLGEWLQPENVQILYEPLSVSQLTETRGLSVRTI